MAVPSQEPNLSKEQRPALALLASIPHGITEDLRAHLHNNVMDAWSRCTDGSTIFQFFIDGV
jgi:hypothetical protein